MDASLADNIALNYFGNDVINVERLYEVVRQAQLEDFVNSLPEGLDTRIGHSAMRLSGGEGQRILVARALYRDAILLIFDEATSALDKVTERKIMNAVLSASHNKSVLIITHEPDVFEASDQVVFMKNGQVEALGSYQDLPQSSPEFAEFAGHQALPNESTRVHTPA